MKFDEQSEKKASMHELGVYYLSDGIIIRSTNPPIEMALTICYSEQIFPKMTVPSDIQQIYPEFLGKL